MIYLIIILIFVFILGVLYTFSKYLKLREFDSVIKVCTDNINDTLDKQEKEIENILDEVKDQKIKEDFVNSRDSDMFIREKGLFDVSWDINKYFEVNKVSVKTKNMLRNINNIEEELEGLKDYYNLNCNRYNELFSKKPFSYLYKLLKFEKKSAFKTRKLENYEILKD